MSYKKASKQKLRIITPHGPLTVEQMWDLPITTLDKIAVQLEEDYKASGGKSFLEAKSKKDKDLKLSFDIVLDILQTKLADSEKASKSAETKAHNQKILGLIANAKDNELKGKTVEELEEMLK